MASMHKTNRTESAPTTVPDALQDGAGYGALDDRIVLYGTVEDSIVDGAGLRFGVFVQGCPHRCPGCHNPASQPFEGGYVRTVGQVLDDIESSRLDRSVTLSGGEPFSQAEALFALATELKRREYDVWVYSGYLYEDLAAGHPDQWAPLLLSACDVLVDGPYVERLHSHDLLWKGSSNQRVIDLAKTRETGKLTLWEPEQLPFQPPTEW